MTVRDLMILHTKTSMSTRVIGDPSMHRTKNLHQLHRRPFLTKFQLKKLPAAPHEWGLKNAINNFDNKITTPVNIHSLQSFLHDHPDTNLRIIL